ncbi:MAG: gamma-glutamylcyclotransferase family protein [Cytophagales bacterium]
MEIFFYGLFMDIKILEQNGVQIRNQGKGHLKDYKLFIGERASLIPSKGDLAYGILMNVNAKDLEALYSAPGLSDYIPEEVDIQTEDNQTRSALCYNLPKNKLSGTNSNYALALHKLATELGFPKAYLKHIERMI